jgi:ATP adenylyltransferase
VLERLWNGWRATYVQSGGQLPGSGDEGLDDEAGADSRPGGSGSVFTRILASGLTDEETHIVYRGATVFVICNRFPYSVGHLLVLPYREVGELEALEPAEATELWATVTSGVATLKAVYQPEGINVGINLGKPAGGSVSEHLHVHVVPRWTGDANYMTATANTRTIPEALDVTASRIREAWTAVARP